VRGRESATAIRLDVADLNRLRALVENADIVVRWVVLYGQHTSRIHLLSYP